VENEGKFSRFQIKASSKVDQNFLKIFHRRNLTLQIIIKKLQNQETNFPAQFHSHFVSFRRRKILTKNKKKTVGKTEKIFKWKKISKNIQSNFRTWLGEMSKIKSAKKSVKF
jgi:hypothetical protein